MADPLTPWSHRVRLVEAARRPTIDLVADAGQRQAIASALDLPAVGALTASLTLAPWLDGAELTGHFHARVEQICGVTLDRFESEIDGPIDVRLVPRGSPNAGPESPELELDPESDDPPDVLDGDEIDVAAYVVEHFALSLDPFPRKPGATFDYQPSVREESPFAALSALKTPKTPS